MIGTTTTVLHSRDADEAAQGPSTRLLLDAHIHLLSQVLDFIEMLRLSAPAGYAFGEKVGPHVRHILEHYLALFQAVRGGHPVQERCVDYDARARHRMIESNPDAARLLIHMVQNELARGRTTLAQDLATPLVTRLTSGPHGDVMLTVPTSLGRELLFLESHTIHHMALLADYVRGLGIAPDCNFGKSPATIAFERHQKGEGE